MHLCSTVTLLPAGVAAALGIANPPSMPPLASLDIRFSNWGFYKLYVGFPAIASSKQRIHQSYRLLYNFSVAQTANNETCITFVEPGHELRIRWCSPTQRIAFLEALQFARQFACVPNHTLIALEQSLGLSMPEMDPDEPGRSDPFVDRLPAEVRFLRLTGPRYMRIDAQILNLSNLTVLDMHGNDIMELPEQIGDIGLEELRLGENRLCMGTWKWLNGKRLQETLHSLCLNGNGLVVFPDGLLKLHNLRLLDVGNNRLMRLPYNIDRLTMLHTFIASNNLLESIPIALSDRYYKFLDFTRNAHLTASSGLFNDFQPVWKQAFQLGAARLSLLTVNSLLNMAARVVADKSLPYTSATLPATLVELLDESPTCAMCNTLCTVDDIVRGSLFLNVMNKQCVDVGLFDAAFCSMKCFQGSMGP